MTAPSNTRSARIANRSTSAGEAISLSVVGVTLSSFSQRRALTGRGGVNDSCIYRIALEVYLANLEGAPVDAQNDYDAIIDEIILQIRGNPNLGNAIAVWSAGEFNYGVEHEQSEPWTEEDGTTVFITGVVRFEAWDWQAGPAGSV